MKINKIKTFCKNLWFMIRHYREVKKRDRIWKEETTKVEAQAKRVLQNGLFDTHVDW